ncbi:hypothetical protein LTR29_015758 [Friedmanniomyces endolithicus]|nr:hypothetical protein LTR29_015758 [Friedmanniomyces endolithicus]
MSSPSDDAVHPQYGSRKHSFTGTRRSRSPWGIFAPKRSPSGYPMSNMAQRQHGHDGTDESIPLTPGAGHMEGTNSTISHSTEDPKAMDTSYPAHSHTKPVGLLRHLTTPFTSRPAPAVPASRHAQTMEATKLTFFQRHFTKPVDKDPEKEYVSQNRRFTFRSHGSLLVAAIMLLIILGGVIEGALSVALPHRSRAPAGSTPQNPTPPPPNSLGSPIRAALDDNFPDPDVTFHNGTYYAFATNNAAGIIQRPDNTTGYDYGSSNVQIATSTDFLTWHLLNSTHDPLPDVGDWVIPGMTVIPPKIPKANVWAPAVIQRPSDNKFIMYYSANKRNGTEAEGRHPPPHCIGSAISRTASPAGPYDPLNNTLACPLDQGGAIDPAAFKDKDSTLYVAYKVDGNNIGHGGLCGNTKAPLVPTPIMLQRMAPDGVTNDGAPIQLLDRTAADGPLIEAPALVLSPAGVYFLFYSSGCTRSPSYNVNYATAPNVTGPYTRAGDPLLQTGDWDLLAPGSVGVVGDGRGGYDMVFHARVAAPQGRIRAMFTTKLKFAGHGVEVERDNGTATAA